MDTAFVLTHALLVEPLPVFPVLTLSVLLGSAFLPNPTSLVIVWWFILFTVSLARLVRDQALVHYSPPTADEVRIDVGHAFNPSLAALIGAGHAVTLIMASVWLGEDGVTTPYTLLLCLIFLHGLLAVALETIRFTVAYRVIEAQVLRAFWDQPEWELAQGQTTAWGPMAGPHRLFDRGISLASGSGTKKKKTKNGAPDANRLTELDIDADM